MAYRNASFRRLIATLPCVACGVEGMSQAAHSNEYAHGKGKSIKASDSAIFPLCASSPGRMGCHQRFDERRMFSKSEMLERTESYIARTYMLLMERGLLRVTD